MGYTARNFRGYLSGLGAAKATTLSTSGAATLASLVVTAGATVGTTLGVTGVTTIANGTEANPGLRFASAAGDGLYSTGSAVAFSIAGTLQAYLTSASGLVVNAGGFNANNGITTTLSGKVNATPAAAQSVTGVGVALAPTRMIHEFTSDGNYTLTVAPSIADGTDGQFCLLVNVGANTVTISDQGTLPSSNLRLTGATLAVGPRDSVLLYYSGDVGDWVQVGPLVAVV